jgi:predicted nucleotidyltransferase
MKTAAIIAEYNPFHDGHRYQIEETRRLTGADYVLVLMSGDFVQRGAPAAFNKYIRTEMALYGGADAVIELPSLYALSSAEFFAGGAVTLLNQLGMVDYLSFGSECGDIALLKAHAGILADGAELSLSAFLKQGFSFPAARNQAVLQTENIPDTLLTSPNNILALEYCKSLLVTGSSITPVTIRRKGASYHETALQGTEDYNSAAAIRNAMENGRVMAQYPSCFLSCNDFSALLHYKLLTECGQGFTQYLDCSHDLSAKIIKKLPDFTDFTGFCTLLKSRDITYTRISRVLTHILLGITTPQAYSQPLSERKLPVSYARLLGFRKEAAGLLSSVKRNSSIPLISKLADASSLLDSQALSMLEQDIFTADIYESVFSHKYNKRPSVNEYRQSPVRV